MKSTILYSMLIVEMFYFKTKTTTMSFYLVGQAVIPLLLNKERDKQL